MSEIDDSRISDTRWVLAQQIRLNRRVVREMSHRAIETEGTDWQLASAYRHEATAHRGTLAALRTVSRILRWGL